LEAVCIRATRSDPGDRFASAREISEAVERFLDGDRDLERRGQLAEEHALAAKGLVAAARGGDLPEDTRAQALREVGSALAFDARNMDARRILVELLTDVPRRIPADAQAEIDRSDVEAERVGARGGAAAYLGWLFGAALVACLAATRARYGGRTLLPLAVVANAAGIAVSCAAFGPFVFAYAGAVGTTMAFLMVPRGWSRWITIALGALSTAVPAVLQWLAVWPPSYRFHDGGMTLVPRMIELPEDLTYLTLTVGGSVSLIVAGVFMARTREALTRAERRLHLHAWQLRQLVSEGPGAA
jgi:serine/threonine-protein kinase